MKGGKQNKPKIQNKKEWPEQGNTKRHKHRTRQGGSKREINKGTKHN